MKPTLHLSRRYTGPEPRPIDLPKDDKQHARLRKNTAIDYYCKKKHIQRRDLMTLSPIGHCLHADAKANKRHVHGSPGPAMQGRCVINKLCICMTDGHSSDNKPFELCQPHSDLPILPNHSLTHARKPPSPLPGPHHEVRGQGHMDYTWKYLEHCNCKQMFYTWLW